MLFIFSTLYTFVVIKQVVDFELCTCSYLRHTLCAIDYLWRVENFVYVGARLLGVSTWMWRETSIIGRAEQKQDQSGSKTSTIRETGMSWNESGCRVNSFLSPEKVGKRLEKWKVCQIIRSVDYNVYVFLTLFLCIKSGDKIFNKIWGIDLELVML